MERFRRHHANHLPPRAATGTGPISLQTSAGHGETTGLRPAQLLGSHEERFGEMLVLLDADTLLLSVAAPPMTRPECETVAAEHFAFCPDQQDPQDGRIFTLRTYADMIRGARQWRFWWD
jgi:hypothetical protein